MSIAGRIGRGEYGVGSLIPPEEQLCREFGLSRFTVRQALSRLQQTGLVQRRQGVGTEVIAAAPPRTFTYTLGSIEQLQQYAHQSRLTRHRMTMVDADPALAAELGCAPGGRFLRIDALRMPAGATSSSEPIAWTRVYLIEAYAGIRDRLKAFDGHIGTLVEQTYGERISAIDQTMSAVAIDLALAKRLRVPAGSPGLRVDRRYLGRDGKPFQFVVAIHAGARFTMSTRLERSTSI
jgi:DNA-binding GntR family transcriptional regulator